MESVEKDSGGIFSGRLLMTMCLTILATLFGFHWYHEVVGDDPPYLKYVEPKTAAVCKEYAAQNISVIPGAKALRLESCVADLDPDFSKRQSGELQAPWLAHDAVNRDKYK